MKPKYILGIDQGGTKTAALVCDTDGNILGTGFADGLYTVYFNDTEGVFLKRIARAAKDACDAAGIKPRDVSAACGGLNGADWDYEYPILTERMSHALNIPDTIVLNDCMAAMRGGSPNRECAVICAGSGLNAAVRRADGQQVIYGYFIDGKYQGASALGTAALRKVMDAYLGICGQTSLTELILGYTGHSSALELMMDISAEKYKLDNKLLAPLLLKAYAGGDKESAGVVCDFSYGAARYITAAMNGLRMNGRALDIVFSGGVFKDNGVLVADRIYDFIALTEPGARKVHARYEPVCGAALTVLDREYGGEMPGKVKDSFDESAGARGLLRSLKG